MAPGISDTPAIRRTPASTATCRPLQNVVLPPPAHGDLPSPRAVLYVSLSGRRLFPRRLYHGDRVFPRLSVHSAQRLVLVACNGASLRISAPGREREDVRDPAALDDQFHVLPTAAGSLTISKRAITRCQELVAEAVGMDGQWGQASARARMALRFRGEKPFATEQCRREAGLGLSITFAFSSGRRCRFPGRRTRHRQASTRGRGERYSIVKSVLLTIISDGVWILTADCGRSTVFKIPLPRIAHACRRYRA